MPASRSCERMIDGARVCQPRYDGPCDAMLSGGHGHMLWLQSALSATRRTLAMAALRSEEDAASKLRRTAPGDTWDRLAWLSAVARVDGGIVIVPDVPARFDTSRRSIPMSRPSSVVCAQHDACTWAT